MEFQTGLTSSQLYVFHTYFDALHYNIVNIIIFIYIIGSFLPSLLSFMHFANLIHCLTMVI